MSLTRSLTLPLTRALSHAELTQKLGGSFSPYALNPYLLFDARDSMIGTLENPTLDLNPALPETLDVITAVRAGVASYTDASGLIQSATANTVRVDHSLGYPAMLIEPSATNLLTYSEDFSNAAWSKNNVTVVDNSTTSPNGSLNAVKLVESATTSTHFTWTQATTTAASHSFSLFAKAGERKRIGLRDNQFGNSAVFDLESGSVIAGSGGSITEAANGFFRITLTGTYAAAGTRHEIYVLPDNATTANASYTGDGTSGVYIWGAQLEAGSVATSYIPTSGSAATRAKDDLSITGSAFSDFYNQSEGTTYMEVVPEPSASTSILFEYMDESAGADEIMGSYLTSGTSYFYAITSGSFVANASLGTTNLSELNRIAVNYKVNDMFGSVNGATSFRYTSLALPTGIDKLAIGNDNSGNLSITARIKRLIYWPNHSDSL